MLRPLLGRSGLTLLIVASWAAAPGCGPVEIHRRDGFTRVTFSGPPTSEPDSELRTSRAGEKGVLNGGVLIAGVGQPGFPFYGTARLAAEDDPAGEMILPNGSYRFLAIGYDTLGMDSQVKCGIGNGGSPVSLGGIETVIPFTLTAGNCTSQPEFMASQFLGSGGIPGLKLHSCANGALPVPGSCGATCGACTAGSAGSFRIELTNVGLGGGGVGRCVAAASGGGGSMAAPLIPVGNDPASFGKSFSVKVLGFSSGDTTCAGAPAREYFLSDGLFTGIPGARLLRGSAGSDFNHLYLESPSGGPLR